MLNMFLLFHSDTVGLLMMISIIFSCLNAVMLATQFDAAVQTLKQLQEKFSPQDMLTVIQRSMELLTEAYEHAMASK